jgi:hypothetical protein
LLEDRVLAGGGAHEYAIALRPGDALFGAVIQRGIDAVVRIRDPRQQAVLEVDSPNGTAGPEPSSARTTAASRTAAAAGAPRHRRDARRAGCPRLSV